MNVTTNDLPQKSHSVFITGVTSGIGAATTADLLRLGYRVCGTYRSEQRLSEFLKTQNLNRDHFESFTGGIALKDRSLVFIKVDLANENEVANALPITKQQFGDVDILINNAGMELFGFCEDVSLEEYKKQFEINFFQIIRFCHAFIPNMKKNRFGRIINVSSGAGEIGLPGLSAYCASKSALDGFSEALSHELSFYNIPVVLIKPGAVKTSIFSENKNVAKKLATSESLYPNWSAWLLSEADKLINKNGMPADAVSSVIVKSLQQKKPKTTIFVGKDVRALLFIKAFIPQFLLKKLLCPFLKLKTA